MERTGAAAVGAGPLVMGLVCPFTTIAEADEAREYVVSETTIAELPGARV